MFKNTFRDIETVFRMLGDQRGAQFEFECYDVRPLPSVAFYLKQNHIKAPVIFQFSMGVLRGIDACADGLMVMKETADRLLGDAYRLWVLAAGRQQMPSAR